MSTKTKEVEEMQDASIETKEQAQPKAAAAAPTELTVQDLQALKVIIDVASQRGAFKPGEMVTVGQTYNKLESFLEVIAASQKAAS